MGSKRILLSSVHEEILGEAPQSYSSSKKYEWKNLILHLSDQATREKPDHVAALHLPLDMPRRVEDSMTEPKGCYDLHKTGEIMRNRYCNFATYGVKRLGSSHGHGHSSESPGDGVGGCSLPCCSYGKIHGKYDACHNHSSEWAKHSISPEPGPVRSYRTKRSPSLDHVPHCAKGLNRSDSQNREYHDDRYLPTKFMDDHFSDIDAARHRSYMRTFQSSSKHIPVHPSHGQSCQRDEVAEALPKTPVNGFHPVHHEQLELSPNEDLNECSSHSRNLRNAYNGKVVKKKSSRQDFLGNTYNGTSSGQYDRNHSRKRNADHLGGKQARKNGASSGHYDRNHCRKPNADHLGGKKARKNGASSGQYDRNHCRKRNADHLGEKKANKGKFKRLCYPIEQDKRQQVESDKMRNDSREGNVEITKLVYQYGAKRNLNPKKNATAPDCSGSAKCDEKNMLSPKCNKTIASSHAQNLSEGSADMDLESDNDVDGCTERVIPQHIPVTHTERDIQLKISDNVSQSEALRRDCLILWRERQLRKMTAAKADNIVKADQQQTAQRSKMSTGRRVRSGGPAASSSSESDNEDDTASECSDQFSRATSSYELQKCGEGRANKKLEQTIQFRGNSKCNKRPQKAKAEKGLKCSLKPLPEANPLEIAQPKEKEKLIERRQVSTDHPDAEVHSSLNGCSGTCKVDQSAVSYCDNSARQNISQQEKNNADLNTGREEKPGVKCEKKAGHSAKLAEQSTGFYADLILLEKEAVGGCSMHGTSKVNALKAPDHVIASSSFDGSILPRVTASMRPKKSINQSSESYCIDFENCLDGNDCRDNQQQTKYDNVLRNKQECSLLAVTEDELNAKARKEDCQPRARRLEIASNQRITTEDCASETIHYGAAKQDDRILRPSIPDLNYSPCMSSDEDFMAPPEELVCQVSADSLQLQSISTSLSASLTGPTSKGEQFEQVEEKQCSQAEATNQITREVCKDRTSETATQLQISESNTGPPQVSPVEESSTSINALKFALYEFVRSFLKPLWDKGLLSRDVHKLIAKKAVHKVADVWAHSAEINIPRILSDEAENIRTLVKGYLQIYVGGEVLKKNLPGSC